MADPAPSASHVPMPAEVRAIIDAAEAKLTAMRADVAVAEATGDNARADAIHGWIYDAAKDVIHLRHREAHYASHPGDMPWQRVVMEIDAMPGVPTWKEIERQVDAALMTQLDGAFQQQRLPLSRRDFYVQFMTRDHLLLSNWEGHLARLFPTVYAHLQRRPEAHDQMVHYGVSVWFAFRVDSNRADRRLGLFYDAWQHMRETYELNAFEKTTYVWSRVDADDVQELLQWADNKQTEYDTIRDAGALRRMNDDLARFKADLRTALARKTARPYLAQSGVIEMLAARTGPDVAQSIARMIAPHSVTTTRPIHVRPLVLLLQLGQLRATVANEVGQPAPDALARATHQLEQLVDDVERESKKQKREQ